MTLNKISASKKLRRDSKDAVTSHKKMTKMMMMMMVLLTKVEKSMPMILLIMVSIIHSHKKLTRKYKRRKSLIQLTMRARQTHL